MQSHRERFVEHKKHEIWAVCIFVVTLLIFFSLVSYDQNDPTLPYHPGGWIPAKNWIGVAGAHISWYLLGMFGLPAYGICAIGLWLSFSLFKGDFPIPRGGLVCLGLVMALVSTASLLHLHRSSVQLFGQTVMTGGVIGGYLGFFLEKRLYAIGSHILLAGVLVVGLLLSTPLTLRSSWETARLLLRPIAEVFVRLAVMFWRMVHMRSDDAPEPPALTPVAAATPVLEALPPRIIESPPVEVLSPAPQPPRKRIRKELPPPVPTDPGQYALPSLELLDSYETENHKPDWKALEENKTVLEEKLADFGVQGRVNDISPGPVITMYEYAPAPGIKISRIVGLSDDLAMALKAISIRVVAPIPGKAAIGVEIPNLTRAMVSVRTVLASEAFSKSPAALTIALGKDITGQPVVANLSKMPHLLIAGATGTGKSVSINTILSSLLYRNTPDDMRLLLIDPKRIELSSYEGIPHLIHPVVTDAKLATRALAWAVAEMELRYKLLADKNVRNIESYNKALAKEKQKQPKEGEAPPEDGKELKHHHLPYIVIIIDELADLMMVASRDVEESIIRLAQMARAAGIHLILATQRPSVDVLTGIIKANVPTRISFQVSSRIDSRTILDTSGAESLLGSGDMLFLPPGTAKLQRIHGAYISETEVSRLTEFWQAQQLEEDPLIERVDFNGESSADDVAEEDMDEKYDEAVELVIETRQASISMLQRRLRVGYNRAARMIEMMEHQGIVGASDGIKPREVFGRKNS